ncbi:S-methyl-5-thioribose-1-phosphate isomerase [Fimbriimonas ginsengisoli]|uniref:Methylthioribose-1-phosphate isomerase n=1 Tax=Fimbriimonas ginsengisoli Gsoil 348 TaxID=661478 RepID=A0A068NQB9_FIMGI|nr:S-methyl-5-thioribose-1-phosphate isomerase [Fimbriimonas ginsengisoli]AIE85601.1 aIF-2BI family translation initiation factor [Fimbriimonas ginsengisoli Gsoil 348]
MRLTSMRWEDGRLSMLDQRGLPTREEWIPLADHHQVAESIRDMVVRGAPAIGVAAAYGLALAAANGADMDEAAKELAASRPTAVNLFWAIDRIMALPSLNAEAVLAEAKKVEDEDYEMNLAIGRHGQELIHPGWNVLTICNTGALATAGHGTALGVIRSAHDAGKEIHVWSCETRPRQQGLRLTAYELTKEGIPFHSIADSAAASLMRDGRVDCVIAGADRIAANGDTANKIGTYSLAVLARHHGIPFFIAAPTSTLDTKLPNGDAIPIEERGAEEITHIEGIQIAPEACHVFNPGFDVTPGTLIDAIITEEGVHSGPYSFLSERDISSL